MLLSPQSTDIMKCLSLLLVLLFLLSGNVLASVHKEDPAWVQELVNKGYTVQEGEYGIFDTNTCLESDTCYAINPITPYGLMYLRRSGEP